MAVEGGVTFIFDECLSAPVARTLTHCGGKTEPVIRVETLEDRKLRNTKDPVWIRYCAEKGWIIVSSDKRMKVDHDIASLAHETGAIILLLEKSISQRKAWDLLLWHLMRLQKLARGLHRYGAGKAFFVGLDGGLHCIKPSKKTVQQC